MKKIAVKKYTFQRPVDAETLKDAFGHASREMKMTADVDYHPGKVRFDQEGEEKCLQPDFNVEMRYENDIFSATAVPVRTCDRGFSDHFRYVRFYRMDHTKPSVARKLAQRVAGYLQESIFDNQKITP